MNYEKEIERIGKEFGGLRSINRHSNKSALDWLDDYSIKSKQTKNVESPNRIESGKLYYFDYIPSDIKELEYFDSTPLVIALFDNNLVFGGLNIHYYPKEIDKKIMSLIRNKLNPLFESATRSKPYSAINQNPIIIPKMFIDYLKDLNVDFGFRIYNKKNIKNIKVICYEDWAKGFYLPSKFVGVIKEQVHKDYFKSLNKL